MKSITFVTGEAAIILNKALIIADLHLGFEREFYQSGIKFPSQTGKMKERIDNLIRDTNAERLVILGDIKHKVPGISIQELREVPDFLEHFSRKIRVDIIPGNHDSGIEKYVPGTVTVHPSTGMVLGDVYLNHGHTWPGEEFLSCRYLITGHRHPRVEFKDKLGYRFNEQVWVRGRLNHEELKKKYKDLPKRAPEIILMPAYNPNVGGTAVNSRSSMDYKKRIGPLINSVNDTKARIYLLDGTYLGVLAGMMKAKL